MKSPGDHVKVNETFMGSRYRKYVSGPGESIYNKQFKNWWYKKTWKESLGDCMNKVYEVLCACVHDKKIWKFKPRTLLLIVQIKQG